MTDRASGSPAPPLLSAQAIESLLAEKRTASSPCFSITSLPSVDSTNNEVKKAIMQGAAEGTVVVALRQQGGYGRQGRTWSSPIGGLYLSVLLRPEDKGKTVGELASLGLVVSIAVRRTLAMIGFSEELFVKWPNDVISRKGKLCGISVEAIGDAVCVGIGINLFLPLAEEKLDGKHAAAYAVEGLRESELPPHVPPDGIASEQLSYMEHAAAVLLNEMVCTYNRWLVEGFSPFRDEYRAHASLQGKNVQLVSLTNGILHEGVVFDVGTDGCLCLVDEAGSVIHARSGEVHLV